MQALTVTIHVPVEHKALVSVLNLIGMAGLIEFCLVGFVVNIVCCF